MYLCSAMSLIHTERSDMDHTVLPANYPMPAFTTQRIIYTTAPNRHVTKLLYVEPGHANGINLLGLEVCTGRNSTARPGPIRFRPGPARPVFPSTILGPARPVNMWARPGRGPVVASWWWNVVTEKKQKCIGYLLPRRNL